MDSFCLSNRVSFWVQNQKLSQVDKTSYVHGLKNVVTTPCQRICCACDPGTTAQIQDNSNDGFLRILFSLLETSINTNWKLTCNCRLTGQSADYSSYFFMGARRERLGSQDQRPTRPTTIRTTLKDSVSAHYQRANCHRRCRAQD